MQKENPVIKNYILSSEKRIINESLFNNMFYIKTKKADLKQSAPLKKDKIISLNHQQRQLLDQLHIQYQELRI